MNIRDVKIGSGSFAELPVRAGGATVAAKPPLPESANVTMVRLALIIGLLAAGTGSALAATDKALLHAREGAAALLRGKYERAIASYSEALKSKNLQDPRRANIFNDRGVAKWRLKRAKAAIQDFNQAIELFPDYAVVYNNRGNALMDLGRPDEALSDFDRAIALAPAYGVAYNNRGNAFYAMGRLDAALKSYRKATELMPTNAVPFNGRGKAQMARQRPFGAIREFSRAIALNGKYGSAYLNRAKALVKLERHAESVKDYTQAIAYAPQSARLYIARADGYAVNKKYASAVKDLDKAIELGPDSAEAYRRRGAIQAKLKQATKAQADLSKAIELNPNDAQAYADRAWNHVRLGLKEEGLADVTRALEIAPKSVAALKVRGQIYEALERKDEAIADYRKALELDPKHVASKAALKRLTGEEPVLASEPVPAILGEPVEGWVITRRPDGRFIATNKRYPKLRAPLEMYGKGEPRILDWQIPRTGMKGIGVLRYHAGVSSDGADRPLAYVAIIDLWRPRVAAIEPYSWGEDKANWSWQVASVVVTDPAGMSSEIKLRKAPRAPEGRDPRSPWFGNDWMAGRPVARTRPRPQPQRRRSGGGIFNWLFGN